MNKRLAIGVAILAVVLAVCIVFGLIINHNIRLPEQVVDQQTLVFGSSSLVPGSDAALRVVVRTADEGTPIPGAVLKVSLKPSDGGRTQTLYEGTTNEQGTDEITFHVPDDVPESPQLIVETESPLGKDRLEYIINTQRSYKILLTTDKPLYQPGQTIHVRALALSTFDLEPASFQSIELVITDGKGNRVFRETVETSEFGVTSADFVLADEVNTGAYKITAQMNNTSSEKTVTVEHYVLPKFAVDVTTEQNYYLPGQHVSGHLQADYFFGKPVSDGRIRIEGFTFDVDRQVVVEIEGVTDADGGFDFDFDLPDYITGAELEGGVGRFYMQATVTDLTNHSEESSVSLPVAQNAIIIDAVPESGMLRPGVENIVYIVCSYPDGTPAPSNLTVRVDDGQTYQLPTGEYGLAEFRFTPDYPYVEFYITARDAAGNYGETYVYSEGEWQDETVLLRPERATYHVGDTMALTILASVQSGTVYLDIVRDGQTVSTRAVDMQDGQAEILVDLTPDLYGTLELHAYKILSWGAVARDTRLVVVDTPTDLAVTINPDRDEYRPGDTANITFQVEDGHGTGVASILGLAMVDESVFALAEQDPGFAKLYFLLEQELMQPRYDLHGFSIPELVQQPSEDQVIRSTQDSVAQATLASSGSRPSGIQLDSRGMKVNEAYAKRASFFDGVIKGALPFLYILPLVALAASVVQVRRDQMLKHSLIWSALGLVAALILTFILVRLLFFTGLFWYRNIEFVFILIPGLALLALVATAIVSLIHSDWALGVACLSMLFYTGCVILVGVSSDYTPFYPETGFVVGAAMMFLALLLAFGMRAVAFRREGRTFATIMAALVAVPLLFLGGALLTGGGLGGTPMLGAFAGPDMMMFDAAVEEPAAEEPMMEMPMAEEPSDTVDRQAASSGQTEPPRLRQYFPETLYWNPTATTDAQGNLTLDIPMADSITTWRLSALASSQDGRLGATTVGVRVFQDFFIDLDLPLALTQNDEIAVPVGVFNYLPQSQTVRLVLEQDDWFELEGGAEQEITVQANDIQVIYFRIKAVDFGTHPLTVTAYGESMSDAIRKQVTVYPDGKRMDFSISDRLERSIAQQVDIPQNAVPGTAQLAVKIYPGVVSQVVEGLDSILRMPSGCFEQTSSTTYPNVLVLDYLKSTGQVSPETQLKAEEYINLGYQRLTTFEVSGGGFSLFGDAPADRMLTAYGLQEFADMSRVHDVDQALISRAAEWLMSQQESDGSWKNDQGLVHESTWANLENDRLPVTAYVVWSLVEAGYGDDGRVQIGLDYIQEHLAQVNDPYVAALVANALVAGAPEESATGSVLDMLAGTAQTDGDVVYWSSNVATFMGSQGQTGSIETTALATFALLRADAHPELANGGLAYLIHEKDSFGTWYSTQATVLSLKALIESVRVGGEDVEATVSVLLNDGQAHTLQITPENFDVVQLVVFDNMNPGPANTVHIETQGSGDLMYQISGSYYLPWSEVPMDVVVQEPVSIDVSYDRTDLKIDDTVEVSVNVQLNQDGMAEWALIDLGIPPGFSVVAEDLNALVAQYTNVPEDYALPVIKRYELTGRQILIYIGNLSHDQPLSFSYRLRARFPLVAQTPASSVYDYYNPNISGQEHPQTIVVREE